jgi:subtilisin family serine protease
VKSYAGHLERSLKRSDLGFDRGQSNEFLFRPGEFLLHRDDYTVDVGRAMRSWHVEEAPLPEHLRYPDDYPILRFTVPAPTSAAQVVARLSQVADGPEPRIAPNYVFAAERLRMPMPAGPAHPASQHLPANPDPPYRGLPVGVVDTGVVLEHGEPHPYLAGRVSFEPSDEDRIGRDGDGWLDVYDGHGTFVAGRILEQAPGANVHVLRALDDGLADDMTVAAALRTLVERGAMLINLSIGSTVDGAHWPLAVAEELETLDPEVVVVASAGNHGDRRPVWPAAFKRVIAVGAVDETRVRRGDLPPPAPWSNLGWWVDVCAGGVDVLGPLCSFDENDRHDRDDEAETFTGWATWSGTSFAAPKVTGRIAQLAMEEEISPRQAAELVIRDPDLPRIRGLGTYVS